MVDVVQVGVACASHSPARPERTRLLSDRALRRSRGRSQGRLGSHGCDAEVLQWSDPLREDRRDGVVTLRVDAAHLTATFADVVVRVELFPVLYGRKRRRCGGGVCQVRSTVEMCPLHL